MASHSAPPPSSGSTATVAASASASLSPDPHAAKPVTSTRPATAEATRPDLRLTAVTEKQFRDTGSVLSSGAWGELDGLRPRRKLGRRIQSFEKRAPVGQSRTA